MIEHWPWELITADGADARRMVRATRGDGADDGPGRPLDRDPDHAREPADRARADPARHGPCLGGHRYVERARVRVRGGHRRSLRLAWPRSSSTCSVARAPVTRRSPRRPTLRYLGSSCFRKYWQLLGRLEAEGAVRAQAHTIVDACVRADLVESRIDRPRLGRVHQRATDASSAYGLYDVPTLDGGRGLGPSAHGRSETERNPPIEPSGNSQTNAVSSPSSPSWPSQSARFHVRICGRSDGRVDRTLTAS